MTLKNEDIIREYRSAKTEDEKIALRNKLLEQNERFIHKLINVKLKAFREDHDDVFNMAVINFFRAIDVYDPTKGANFITYVSYWINNAILEYYRSRNLIHIPRNTDIGDESMASLALNTRLVWLDKDVIEDGSSYLEVIEDESADSPDGGVDVSKMLEVIDKKLDRAEALTLKYRYLKERPVNKDQMSKLLGLTLDKCSMIETLAMKKLRLLLKGVKANYHIKIRKELPSDEAIEKSYQVMLEGVNV